MWHGNVKRPPPKPQPKLPPTFESSYPSLALTVQDILPNLTSSSSEEANVKTETAAHCFDKDTQWSDVPPDYQSWVDQAQGTAPEPGLQVFLSHAAEESDELENRKTPPTSRSEYIENNGLVVNDGPSGQPRSQTQVDA